MSNVSMRLKVTSLKRLLDEIPVYEQPAHFWFVDINSYL